MSETLNGCRVVVIEDNGTLSMLAQDMLIEMGCVIAASAARLDDATDKCAATDFDVALIDINLEGERTFSLAETLRARDKPFILVTGYGRNAVPESLHTAPLLQKPYREQDLENALKGALAARA